MTSLPSKEDNQTPKKVNPPPTQNEKNRVHKIKTQSSQNVNNISTQNKQINTKLQVHKINIISSLHLHRPQNQHNPEPKTY